jgi:hypothetical protein
MVEIKPRLLDIRLPPKKHKKSPKQGQILIIIRQLE